MEEGEASPQVESISIPDTFESTTAENLSIIKDAILDEPVTPEMARSLSRMHTLHTLKQIDEIVAENPGGIPVMKGFGDVLREALAASDEGDYTDIARFIRSEASRMQGHPDFNPDAVFGKKLSQMAGLLPTK